MISGPRVIGCISDKSQLNQFNAKSGDIVIQPSVREKKGVYDYIWAYEENNGWLVMSKKKSERY